MAAKRTLSSFIVELRTRKGWSQQELAMASGVSLRTVQRIEKGEKPRPESLKAIASVFDKDVEDFVALDRPASDGDEQRLGFITSGADLAQLLGGSVAHQFTHEEVELPAEVEAVGVLLQESAEFIDVFHDLPYTARTEMSARFAQHLNTLWKLDWLVFGNVQEVTLTPGPNPVRGQGVSLHLARCDSPSVKMDPKLRKLMEDFKEATARKGEPPDSVH